MIMPYTMRKVLCSKDQEKLASPKVFEFGPSKEFEVTVLSVDAALLSFDQKPHKVHIPR